VASPLLANVTFSYEPDQVSESSGFRRYWCQLTANTAFVSESCEISTMLSCT
jgi:ligand-binding sensor protein